MMDFSKFILEGHRGVQSLSPENSLASFQKAMDLGVQWVELDLLATKDGRIVIHHDFEIDGRMIYSLSIEEIKQFDVGTRTDPEFPEQQPALNAKIPELAELFEMGKNLFFNLEIKSHPNHPEYTPPLDFFAKKIVEVVRRYGVQNRVYYSSFDPAALLAIRNIEPRASIALLYAKGLGDDWLMPLAKGCMDLKAQIVSPLHTLVNESVIEVFHRHGIKVIPWTVNEKDRFKELVEMGVDGMISDYPQRFLFSGIN
ncbi:MAG TPA: glycerophosphodiester phosphodiesterase family protein [Chlamydiales bacterium]|nr:glycerophosphodiester phosphodiesterase family protein [Chlamydiales bacterium]